MVSNSRLDLELGSLEIIFLIGAPYAVDCFCSIDVCEARTANDTAFANTLPDFFLQVQVRNNHAKNGGLYSQVLFELKPCARSSFFLWRNVKNLLPPCIV
jgi:hypothetical protein